MKKMFRLVKPYECLMVLVFVFILCTVSVAMEFVDTAHDQYSTYLGHEVSVNVCNQTVYQGVLIENWKEPIDQCNDTSISGHIVLREICTPRLGNVSIEKCCIKYIHLTFNCSVAEA